MSCGGCTECCKAPTVFHYIQKGLKGNYPDLIHWKRISRRRAKKLNPHAVKFAKGHGTVSHFRCTKLTDSGCGVYEDRPLVCSKYLGDNEAIVEVLNMSMDVSNEYTDSCNVLVKWVGE